MTQQDPCHGCKALVEAGSPADGLEFTVLFAADADGQCVPDVNLRCVESRPCNLHGTVKFHLANTALVYKIINSRTQESKLLKSPDVDLEMAFDIGTQWCGSSFNTIFVVHEIDGDSEAWIRNITVRCGQC